MYAGVSVPGGSSGFAPGAGGYAGGVSAAFTYCEEHLLPPDPKNPELCVIGVLEQRIQRLEGEVNQQGSPSSRRS